MPIYSVIVGEYILCYGAYVKMQNVSRRTILGASGSLEECHNTSSSSLEEEDKLALFHVLNDQRLGMERLGSIVTRDVRDVDILKEEVGKALDQGRGGSGSVGGMRQQQRGTTAIFGGR